MHAAKGLEFDHVYVLGLMAARMPGPRRRALEPMPDALLRGGAAPRQQGRPRRRDAAPAARRDDARAAAARARLPGAHRARRRCSSRRRSPRRRATAVGGEWEAREEELFGPAETLQSTFRMLRDELLTTVSQVGGRLGELRFDTDLDVSHAVVRYLELLKLAALLERTRAAGRASPTRCRRSTRGCCRRRPPSSARSSRRRRWTSTCSTPSATSGSARARSRRARSRRWRRSCPSAATGWC